MSSYNRVILLGNVVRDPELKHTSRGTALTELSLATNHTWIDDSGVKREDVTWVDVTLWGRLAEIASQYLSKGRPVFIEGRLQLDTWDDKQTGQKRSKLRVVAENMQLLGSREPAASPSVKDQSPPSPPRPATPSVPRPAPASASAHHPPPEPDLEPF